MHHHSKAFTLVELLTVVTIVGLLLAMVVPTVGSAFSLAQETNCNSNLSVIGKAIVAYTQQNDDRLPKNGDSDLPTDDSDEGKANRLPGTNSTNRWWCNKIYPLGHREHGLYTCASDTSHANMSSKVWCSYGFNDTLTDPNSEGGDGVVTIMQITDLGATFLVGHCSDFTPEPAILEGMMTPDDWPTGHVKKWDQEARQQLGRCGFLMASGDVKVLTYSQVKLQKDDAEQLKFFHKD